MNPEPKTELALAPQPVEPQPLAVRSDPTPGDMLKAVLDRGVTGLDVAVVEKLTALYERMEDRKAEKQFAAAFVALQSEMPKIQATKPVPNNDGTVRYKFAPFEDLMRQVGPLLQCHGFTVSFRNRFEENRLVETCVLQHVAGHKVSNDFAVRIGAGPPKATETQADGAAATYAKRFALCDALNIVIAHLDSDAAAEGATITPEQAKDLEARVTKAGVNREFFLQFAGAKTFAEIPSARLALAEEQLRRMSIKVSDQAAVSDPLRALKIKLWELCKPIRGDGLFKNTGWYTLETQLTAWKILRADQNIKCLTQAELKEVIAKAEIAIWQMNPDEKP